MSTDLKHKINDWLDGHGYAFEMLVANIFQKQGFQVSQSVMYRDRETAAIREIDVVASKSFSAGDFIFRFEIVVECKTSKSKPWISFLVSHSEIDLFSQLGNCTEDGEMFLRYVYARDNKLNDLFPTSISKYGYSLTQAFRGNEGSDIIYKALQCLNSSIEYFIQKNNCPTKSIAFYFPVVAID